MKYFESMPKSKDFIFLLYSMPIKKIKLFNKIKANDPTFCQK